MNPLFKTKASTLAKINALPVFRSPADLYNELTLPYDIQNKQINGQLNWSEGKYFSNIHFQLAKKVGASRKEYRGLVDPAAREALSLKENIWWGKYLQTSIKNPSAQLNEEQKQRIYQAMLTAKERTQERLALSRFIKFGYEYSQAFKVDIPLNPVVILKLVHPHFGYLNNIPNINDYKYTHEQIFTFIEQLNAVSLIRDKGHTLHSSELLSFVFWKIIALGKPRLALPQFFDLLKVFKFQGITQQNFGQKFAFSLKEGEVMKADGNIRFDVFRQIFLDRQL